MWKELSGPLNRQHLTMLQRALEDTAWRLRIHAPIVATPGMIKITLELGFYLEHRDGLGLGLHQFRIIQHTSDARKVLNTQAGQHHIIAGGGAVPSLSNTTTLMVTDSVSLTDTQSMSWRAHAQLVVVLDTLFGPNHLTALVMNEINMEIM